MGKAVEEALDLLDPLGCRSRIVALFHGDEARCPSCERRFDTGPSSQFGQGNTVRCLCGRRFTYRSGTPLQGSPADDRQVALYLILSELGIPPARIAEACRISDDTVRRWAVRL